MPLIAFDHAPVKLTRAQESIMKSLSEMTSEVLISREKVCNGICIRRYSDDVGSTTLLHW
jgi:hypothetical protein